MSIANLVTVCLAVQLFMAVALAVGETTGRLRLPYSKFRTGGGVNSRAGLTLSYATPIFVCRATPMLEGNGCRDSIGSQAVLDRKE
jgi:hypothetical protein